MGSAARRIAGGLIVALAIVAIIFGIVGAAATTKGWFKSSTSVSKTQMGTLKSCTTLGGVKLCCKLDSCRDPVLNKKLIPTSVQIGGKVALGATVFALGLLVVAGIIGALTVVGFKGESLIIFGALSAFFAFFFMTGGWATFLGTVYHWADDKNVPRPKSDYGLILTAVGGGLSLLIVFCFAFQATQKHK